MAGGAGYYLQYHKHCCVMVCKDLSHRMWNGVQLAFSESGLKPLMSLLTVVMNSDHGPWAEERWLQEAREAVTTAARVGSTLENAVFVEVLYSSERYFLFQARARAVDCYQLHW